MRHRSIHHLLALCRSRKQILVRNQEAFGVKVAQGEQIRGPIVTVDMLPTELLTEIFYLVEETCTAYDSFDVQYSLPWVLGRVCRRWRIIVQSTPKLWQDISVDHADVQEWTYGQRYLLREILSRSRSRPLQVAYTAAWDEYPVLLSELHPHTNRLSSLELTVQCHQFLDPLFFYGFADTQLPLFESLTLNVECSFFSQTVVTICPRSAPDNILFRHAPRLTRLDIQGITLSHFPLPWSQIREFRGDIMMSNDFGILSQAMHLQEAHIVRCQTPRVVEHSVYLPSLHHLTLYTDDYPCRHTELHCPNLKTFRFARLKPTLNNSRNICTGLDAFVAETQLQTLILDVGVHPFSTIHPIIRACSSRLLVLSLEVNNTMATPLYSQLVANDGLTCLAPHLEQLYIWDTTVQTFTKSDVSPDDIPQVSAFMEPVLMDMVASRVREGGCLRELVLCAPAPYRPSRETQAVLQNLSELETTEGFKCLVHWGYHWTLLDHGVLY